MPTVQLPPLQKRFWQIATVLFSLLVGLSIWLLSQWILPLGQLNSFEQAPVEINQMSEEEGYSYAMQLRQSGDLVGALHELEKVAAIAPQSVPVLYELGRAEFQLGQVQEAIAHYRAALSVEPDHAPSAYELGSMLVTLGHVEEGVQGLRHAAELSPSALYLYDLGIALGRAGDSQAQIDALTQAITLKPDYADAYLNLGLTYARLDVIPEATKHLQRARDLYQAEIETLEHAHLGRNSLDAQVIDQMLLALDSGCGVSCWVTTR